MGKRSAYPLQSCGLGKFEVIGIPCHHFLTRLITSLEGWVVRSLCDIFSCLYRVSTSRSKHMGESCAEAWGQGIKSWLFFRIVVAVQAIVMSKEKRDNRDAGDI